MLSDFRMHHATAHCASPPPWRLQQSLHLARRAGLACLAGLASAFPAEAQGSKPERPTPQDIARGNPDVVRRKDGRQIACRVVEPHGKKEVTVQIDGRRRRIARRSIESITTVNDHLRELLNRRARAKPSAKHAWMLVEWARNKGLPRTADTLAHGIVVRHPEYLPARELLRHRRRGGRWVWPLNGKYVTRDQWDEYHADDGHPLTLQTLHYQVESTAGLERTVDCLLDLERFYLTWLDEFGEPLNAREVLEPMRFKVWTDRDAIPPLTGHRLPYYIPDPNGDFAVTYYTSATAPRPELLFALALEHAFYHALIEMPSTGFTTARDRVAAWVEIGLGQWFESRFEGKPGFARAGEPTIDLEHARLALQARRYGLENLIGLRFGMFHDLTSDMPVHWATTATLVSFLLAPDQTGKAPYRDGFLEYIRLAYRKSRGNSSSLLDKHLGKRIERVEREYLEWLSKRTGLAARRRRR